MDQVVSAYRQGEVPVDLGHSSITGLPELAVVLEPAEYFFDALAESLAHGIPACRVVRPLIVEPPLRSVFCATCGVTNNAHRLDESFGVVVLVGSYRDTSLAVGNIAKHLFRGIPFGKAVGFGNGADHDQPISVLGQHMGRKRKPGLMSAPLRYNRASGSVVEA